MIILILNFLFMFFFLITLCEFLGKRYTTFGLSKPKASIFLFGSLSIFICIISVILEYLYSNKFNNYLLYDLIIIIILLFLIIKSKSGKVINLKQDEYDIVTESKTFTLNGESNTFLISNLVKKINNSYTYILNIPPRKNRNISVLISNIEGKECITAYKYNDKYDLKQVLFLIYMHFLIVISSILYSISKSNTSFSMEFSIAFLSLLCILYIFRKCEAGKTKNEKNIRILMLILSVLILSFHFEILSKFYL